MHKRTLDEVLKHCEHERVEIEIAPGEKVMTWGVKATDFDGKVLCNVARLRVDEITDFIANDVLHLPKLPEPKRLLDDPTSYQMAMAATAKVFEIVEESEGELTPMVKKDATAVVMQLTSKLKGYAEK